MSYKTIELAILRYRPEIDQAPWFQDYRIPCEEDWVVLDAINYIKDHLDSTLSYRWSCHMAVCGSCGMMIDGEPRLSCKTFLRDLPEGKIRIEPLANFPIERDLVVSTR
jgi:fumarate reductase iron-sulfur subunit